MPEGDTIYRVARTLQKALAGRTVTAFATGLAMLARVNDDKPIVGRTVERVEARGKWCLIYFSGDLILVTHMLMSGAWHIYRTDEKWWMPGSSMRVAITCGDRQAVAFNVPIAEFHTAHSLERSSQVPKLGPDILSQHYSAGQGTAAMQSYALTHPDAEVGVTLLNQRVMAGLGNVYKSEVAFAAGVHPFRHISTVTDREMTVMADVAQKYMRANVLDGSSEGIVTYSGNRRTTHSMNVGERLWVYGRKGEECRRCGTPIERRLQGEQARPTYWCSNCQPWVAAEGHNAFPPVGQKDKTSGMPRRRQSC